MILRYMCTKQLFVQQAEQGVSLLSSKFVSMDVLRDDFAAVDVREELC